MYNWRKMSDEERRQALKIRRARKLPWHSPPHLDFEGDRQYFISSACYEHAPIIGRSPERLTECEEGLLEVCHNFCRSLYAWCILPNHYHAVIKTDQIKALRQGWGNFTDAPRSFGTQRTTPAGARFGIIHSSGLLNLSVIFGLH